MSDRHIITAIQKVAGTFKEDKVKLSVGIVQSIQGNTCTVTIDDQMVLPAVNLQAASCDGWLLVPSVGSTVVIAYSTQISAFVALYSDIDHAYLQVGDSSITILKDGNIGLNDGSFKGLVKGGALTQKLNNLENKVNELISNFNAHTHGVVAVGSPTSPTTTPISGTLTPTTEADIENNKITHGI